MRAVDGRCRVHTAKREPGCAREVSWVLMTRGCNAGSHHLRNAQCRELFDATRQIAERARSLGLIAPSVLIPPSEPDTRESVHWPNTTGNAAYELMSDLTVMAEGAAESSDALTHHGLVRRIAAKEKATGLLRRHLH